MTFTDAASLLDDLSNAAPPIVFRPVDASMFEALAAAYCRQWGAPEDRGSPAWRLWAADLVEKATLGFTAWREDALFGLAVGHAAGAATLALPPGWVSAAEWRRREAALHPEAPDFFGLIESANKRLRAEAAARGLESSAELDFLWVAPEARGLGLSKQLLSLFAAALREAGEPRFALFTDSDCHFSYYERAPWQRWGELPWPEETARAVGLPGLRSFMFAREV